MLSLSRLVAFAALSMLSTMASAQITFFTDCNFLGKTVTLSAGVYTVADLKSAGLDNDSISAAVVPEGFSATLYMDDRFGGRSGILRRTSSCLEEDGFNNVISSLTVQVAGTEDAAADSVRNRQIRPRELVTVYSDCRYKGAATSLQPGEYRLAELQAMGINNNDISSVSVPPGFEITVFENDFFRGKNATFTASDQCLRGDGLDNVSSSLIISGSLNASQETAEQAPADSASEAISIFSECNYQGLGFRLKPGKYLATDLQKLGMPNNAISSLRVPRAFKVSVYENDFFRGTAKVLRADDSCLIGDQINDKISSIVVETASVGSAIEATSNNTSQSEVAATLYSKCSFAGKQLPLKVGDYNVEDLTQMGFANNSLSSVGVVSGYQVELFFNDFHRGKSGYLRADDDCLANDGFDNEVSSIKVTRVDGEDKPLTQVDGGARAATVYQHCDYKGGSVALKPGRYTQDKLREIGIGNDVISSLKVAPGYQVVLYDNGQMRGRGVAIEGDDRCLDDDGLYRRVSSLYLVRKPAATPAGNSAEDKIRAAAALDTSLQCVELYVEREICDEQRWPDIVERCKLEQVPALVDGFLQGHVERGNCKSRYWTQLVQRIRNPSLR